MQTLALAVAAGDTDIMGQVTALDSATLNQGYGQVSAKRPTFTHNLLREAMLARNFGATEVLIAKGANFAFKDNELPFALVSRPDRPQDMWFPDYSTGNAMLSAWPRAGGDPQVTHVRLNRSHWEKHPDVLADDDDGFRCCLYLPKNRGTDGIGAFPQSWSSATATAKNPTASN
ncbi:hypothetical protein [Nereida sp. MMG025]|uniref:hypothetical protein n=1 Tax=Nereida sp. MMG025 TaxID=2909981 RepID=UPI001F243DCD|nr:hypothetical protein [Nereida sp. MMG025]MCF6445891.1 hypothetical protein [Nereida sp. MMG025]